MLAFEKKDLGLRIGKIPERKKPVIMLRKDNCDYVVGQVRDNIDAEAIMYMIAYCVGNDEKAGDIVRDIICDWDKE